MDAGALVGHLVSAGSVFAFLAEHRGEVFPSELFVDLFPSSTGRPSLPGEVAASVLVLQTLQDLSDRDAVVAVRCDIRWKVCGLPLDHEGFHPSTLTYWRRRLAVSDAMKERGLRSRDVPRHSRGAHFHDEGGPCERSLCG
jgi:hypothetical protein